MRHRKLSKKLGRSSAHRKVLVSSLVCHLIEQRRIRTTLAKGRVARSMAEKMVTLGRKQTEAARRLAVARLRHPKVVKVLFEEIVPSMEGRNGGYTRIVKLGRRRSDGSEMCILEWVQGGVASASEPEAPEAVVEDAAE